MSWSSRFAADPELADFTCLDEGGARIIIRRGYDDPVTRATILGGDGGRIVGRTRGGRGSHPVVELSSGERVLLRDFRRGGAIRHFNAATYVLGNRALAELRTTVIAGNRGVAVPRVIAAVERPGRFGYSAMLATIWIDGALDLATWLELAAVADRQGLAAMAGAAVGKMHEAGVTHPDLNLRNLLIAPGADSSRPRVVIIDFDRARAGTGPVPGWRRRAELRRFVRSAWRLGAPMGEREFASFRDGYGSGWPLRARLG